MVVLDASYKRTGSLPLELAVALAKEHSTPRPVESPVANPLEARWR